ncbi:MAG: hypothetical protein JO165_07365 [Candidatus Eremiobacteraeota bacterium]|nr:hypothetical protein [Candidatus Eremiobacteraeota bacterium]
MREGWLSYFFGEDDRRRLVLSFAIAIALIELAAALVPLRNAQRNQAEPEKLTIARIVRIEHRPRPTPKPTPTPKPVRRIVIAPRHTVATVVNPGNVGRKTSVHRPAQAHAIATTHYHLQPRYHVVTGAQGAGESKTSKNLTGGGAGNTGSGSGSGGTGNGLGGPPASDEPCGYVDFVPSAIDHNGDTTVYTMQMTVHFPDHHAESVILDWPWRYVSAGDDPWSDQNMNNPAFENGVRMQFPPASQMPNEPALVQYVLQHSRANGTTKLQNCPG